MPFRQVTLRLHFHAALIGNSKKIISHTRYGKCLTLTISKLLSYKRIKKRPLFRRAFFYSSEPFRLGIISLAIYY